MAKELQIQLLSPEGKLFDGAARQVTVPALNGLMGVLPGHAPLIAQLLSGVATIDTGAEKLFFMIDQGFVEVRPDHVVVVLADVARVAKDGDDARAMLKARRSEDSPA